MGNDEAKAGVQSDASWIPAFAGMTGQKSPDLIQENIFLMQNPGSMESAIEREKAIKKWNRSWKMRLIEESNPQWKDLWVMLEEGLDSRLRGNDEKSNS
ncbi:MAG: hypothetical protein AAB899_03095 [Patescibacteria group bacterium]